MPEIDALIENIGRLVKLIGQKTGVEIERTPLCVYCCLQEAGYLAIGVFETLRR